MTDEITTTIKWVGGLVTVLLGFLSLPLGWLWVRQNRFEDGMVKMTEAATEMRECAARMDTHQEHMLEDIREIKMTMQQRRADYSHTETQNKIDGESNDNS